MPDPWSATLKTPEHLRYQYNEVKEKFFGGGTWHGTRTGMPKKRHFSGFRGGPGPLIMKFGGGVSWPRPVWPAIYSVLSYDGVLSIGICHITRTHRPLTPRPKVFVLVY